jgi:hypothetical protein
VRPVATVPPVSSSDFFVRISALDFFVRMSLLGFL